MNVLFIKTTSDKLKSLPITNGQLIALEDKSAMYYDLNNTRFLIRTEKISELENDSDFIIFDEEDNSSVTTDTMEEITLTGIDIDGNTHNYVIYGKEVN